MLPHQSNQKNCPGAPARSRKHASFHGQPPRPLNLDVLECPWAPKKPEGSLTLSKGFQGQKLFTAKCPGAPMKQRRSAHLLEGVQGKELFPAKCPGAPMKKRRSAHLLEGVQGQELFP